LNFEDQPFNWLLSAGGSSNLRWPQLVIGTKACELFSPNHVDSIDAALAKSLWISFNVIIFVVVGPK